VEKPIFRKKNRKIQAHGKTTKQLEQINRDQKRFENIPVK
jgi:hypothetical protein